MEQDVERDRTEATGRNTMKAIFYERYGAPERVLELREIKKPVVGDDQVLVRVQAASVNPLDWHLLTGTPYIVRPDAGLRRPKRHIPGADIAGTVDQVGRNVTRFRTGDEVFGEINGRGLAEYVAVPENRLVAKPANLALEEAAAIGVAGLTALQGLRDWGGMKADDKVLINGASGGVGTFAVQVAKALGAEVTAVCSTRNVELVRSLGADQVIDYTKEDFTRTGQRYDVFFDAVGNRSLLACRRVLTPDGIYVAVSGPKHRWLGPIPRLLRAMVLFRFSSQRAALFKIAQPDTDDLTFLKGLVEAGKVRPVIDQRYQLHEAPEAIRKMGGGHGRGKSIVII